MPEALKILVRRGRPRPFELRYLAGRRAPERWIIDLGSTGAKAKTLFRPQTYFRIPTEDRLWIPEEYVPLFVEKGWRRGNAGELAR